MNIKSFHFEQIIKKGYSLDIVYLLTLIKEEFDINDLCENSAKIKAIYNSVIRKGLITEDGKITLLGEELLKFINIETEVVLKKKIDKVSDFDAWWESFPSNNKFTHKGISFKPTRSFRTRKNDCKTLFNKIINEKKFTAEQIIEATKYDVFLKKENSVKKRENQLTYLQNTYTYLYQGTFEGFVDLINDDKELINNVPKGATDI